MQQPPNPPLWQAMPRGIFTDMSAKADFLAAGAHLGVLGCRTPGKETCSYRPAQNAGNRVVSKYHIRAPLPGLVS